MGGSVIVVVVDYYFVVKVFGFVIYVVYIEGDVGFEVIKSVFYVVCYVYIGYGLDVKLIVGFVCVFKVFFDLGFVKFCCFGNEFKWQLFVGDFGGQFYCCFYFGVEIDGDVWIYVENGLEWFVNFYGVFFSEGKRDFFVIMGDWIFVCLDFFYNGDVVFDFMVRVFLRLFVLVFDDLRV